jgi:hypothetical protein
MWRPRLKEGGVKVRERRDRVIKNRHRRTCFFDWGFLALSVNVVEMVTRVPENR